MNDIDGGIAVAENLFTDENAEYSAVIFGKRVIEGNALNGKVAGDGGFALGLVFLGDGALMIESLGSTQTLEGAI